MGATYLGVPGNKSSRSSITARVSHREASNNNNNPNTRITLLLRLDIVWWVGSTSSCMGDNDPRFQNLYIRG